MTEITALIPKNRAVHTFDKDLRTDGHAHFRAELVRAVLALAQALVCLPKFVLAGEMPLALAPLIVKRLMGVVERLARKVREYC